MQISIEIYTYIYFAKDEATKNVHCNLSHHGNGPSVS